MKTIHLEKNIGGAYGPRNIALNYVNGEYIMFIDSDDTYPEDACEILYNKITEYMCDIVFGRYLRHYPEENIIRKSYTPYKDTLNKVENKYLDDLIEGSNFKGLVNLIWKNIISKLFYGRSIDLSKNKNYKTNNINKRTNTNNPYKNNINNKNPNEEIFIKEIMKENKEEIAILKMLPSFWTKIYRTDLIKNNNITFPEYISAEDLNFLIEAYIKNEKGILFLNNKIVYNYYMRFNVEEKSITKNITFRLIYDSLKAYRQSSQTCDKYHLKNKDLFLNHYLLYWINLWLNRNNTKEENRLFLKEVNKIESGLKHGIKYRMILFLTKFLLKLKS